MTSLSVVKPQAAVGPPCNIEAEQALLGCVLFQNDAFRAVGHLRPDQFFEPLHSRLWEAISETILKQTLVEPILLLGRFQSDPAFIELGGLPYLMDLMDRAPPHTYAADYANAIAEAWARRQTMLTCAEASAAAAHDDGRPVVALLGELRTSLEHLESAAAPDDGNMISASDAAATVMGELDQEAEHGRARGALTGLRCFDRRLGGLKPGWLLVIGGRPSMGKTALARACAFGAARKNPTMLFPFFSIEMDRRELIERTMSQLMEEGGEGIAYQDIANGKTTPMERARLDEVRRRIPDNLLIDDRGALTVDDVRRRVWALKRRGPIGAVFIDYLQIMRRPRAEGRNETTVIGEMTAALKQLARDAQTCVVLLSQLSRQVESRDDKRPQLSDLRESGSIEQDADAVLFPYREVYYLQRSEPQANTAEHTKWQEKVDLLARRMDVIAAKVRKGAAGTDHQEYRAEFDLIIDLHEGNHG